MIEFITKIAVLVVIGISLVAFFITLDAFFSGRLDKTRQSITMQPGRAFLIGLINASFFGSIVLGFFLLAQWTSNLFILPALVFLTPLAVAAVAGTGGMIAIVGERLFPGHPRHRQIIFATALLYIACLAPFVGWFGLTAFLGITGLGGFLLSFLKREEETVISDQFPTATSGELENQPTS